MFIFGFGPIPAFGVEGAAIATTIGRGTAVLFQLAILFYGYSKIKIGIRDITIRFGVMLNLLRVSIGGIGQFLIGTSSWVFLMRIMSEFGSEVLAGYTIAIRVMLFTLMPAWGMSSAAASLVGQNLGAKKPERAEQSVWKTAVYGSVFMGFVSIIYLVLAPQIIQLFNETSDVVKYGSLCLRILTAPFVFYGFGMIVLNAFNGAGDTKTPTYINFVCFWLLQLPFAYVAAMTLNYGPVGVFWAIALGELVMTIISVIWFKKGYWKLIKV
jgi:putative MATE family efflux protein